MICAIVGIGAIHETLRNAPGAIFSRGAATPVSPFFATRIGPEVITPLKLSATSKTMWTLIGIGGHLAMSPLPHHRAYGSVPRRFGRLSRHCGSR